VPNTGTVTGTYSWFVASAARAPYIFKLQTIDSVVVTEIQRNTVTGLGTKGPLLSSSAFHDRLVFERWTLAPGYEQMTDAAVEQVEMIDLVVGVPGEQHDRLHADVSHRQLATSRSSLRRYRGRR
jgi:hypothetical protein